MITKSPIRNNIRLKNYDYSQNGYYFITICTHNRENLFGKIINGKMVLNEYGNIVNKEWLVSAKIRKEIKIDKFVVMPNHFHAIVIIQNVGMYGNTSANTDENQKRMYIHTSLQSPSHTLGAMIRGFKSSGTAKINTIRNTEQNPVWQKSYYDHIIRNEQDYKEIYEYIENNPQKWELDKYYIL